MKPAAISTRYTWFYFVLMGLALLTSDQGQIAGDGLVRWDALQTLMSKHQLTGEKYSIVQPLFAAPFYMAGELYARATGLPPAARSKAIRRVVQKFNKVVALGLLIWFYTFLIKTAGWRLVPASLATTYLLFGSLLIPHAKDFYSECLWTLLCLWMLTQFCGFMDKSLRDIERYKAVAFVSLAACLVPLNPLLVLVLGALTGIALAIRLVQPVPPSSANHRMIFALTRPEVVLTSLAILFGVGLCLLENVLRRGDVVDFGYPGEGFSTPFLHGFCGAWIAPARGILIFIPTFLCGLVLLLNRSITMPNPLRRFLTWSLIFSSLLVLCYAKWHAWHGAWYWGPRFFLPLSILGSLYFVLLARLTWRRSGAWGRGSLAIMGLLSYMVYKVGVGIGQRPLVECLALNPDTDACYWKWEFLPYLSWVNVHDLCAMFVHRSTAVEVVIMLLMLVLVRGVPGEASGGKINT